MNTEELKFVLEAIGAATDKGATFAMWWLAADLMGVALRCGVALAAIGGIYKLIRYAIACRMDLSEIARAYDGTNTLIGRDVRAICQILKEHHERKADT